MFVFPSGIPCGVPPIPQNGNTTDTGYLYGDVVTVHCKEGYAALPVNTLECFANGTWTGNPECMRKYYK